jgi:hypothetical protein
MPRIQLYLPDPLFEAVKDLELPASEMLQKAVSAELGRREKLAELDSLIAKLEAEVGPPSASDLAWAEHIEQLLNDRS